MNINNIMNSCIIVLRPINNLGVTFMNMYHEYKIIHIYEEKMWWGSQQVYHVVPSSNLIVSNISLLHLIVYRI